MPKVRGPLLSLKARGTFGKAIIYTRAGDARVYFKPRNPNSPAQQAQRQWFLEQYMAGLTQEQADLLYAAIAHLHDEIYSPLGHGHDHGVLSGLNDDDHTQYYNQARGDARYSLLGHGHAGAYATISHQHAADYYGLSVLSSTFNLTGSAGVFEDTGLSVTLPAAGTYEIFGNIRGVVRGNAGTVWWISVKLYNSTDGADVADSARMVVAVYTTNTYFQGTTPLDIQVTVNGPKVIKLYACRNGNSSPTWLNSGIYVGDEGKTVLGYRFIGTG